MHIVNAAIFKHFEYDETKGPILLSLLLALHKHDSTDLSRGAAALHQGK